MLSVQPTETEMNRTLVYNFTKAEKFEVSSSDLDNVGPLVTLQQTVAGSSCWFSFSMTPEQARKMAQALIEHANKLENQQ